MSIKSRVGKLESVLRRDSTGIGEWTGIIPREAEETIVAYKNRYNNTVREAISDCRTFFDLLKERQEIKK